MITNIVEYLKDSAIKHADTIAFDDFSKSVTFGELYESTNKIASGLLGFVHKPVAIFIDKSVECLEAMYGVIASGNFYTILDTKMPVERIKKILDQLEPVAVITTNKNRETAETFGLEEVKIYEDLVKTKINQKQLDIVAQSAIDTDPVYTLFTSGSTGTPKGYTVNHKGVIDFIESMTDTFGFSSKDIFANQSPLYFDLSIYDVFGTLKNGHTTYLIPQMYFMFPVKLVEILNEKKVKNIFWVPSALVLAAQALEVIKPKYLKRVLFCGEVMPNKQLNIWREHLPNVMYANLYGPAETVDASAYYIIDRKFRDDEALPIGKAFKNTRLLVISEEDTEITGEDEIGELCICGSSLSMGYYGNHEKTDAAYVQNPLNDKYIELIYKTGDLVKYNKRHELVFVSRKDYQIKHMGYRIELGEIETAISMVDGIKTQACIYDDDADKIVMFYTGKKLTDKEIVDNLAKQVPAYMIPNVIVRLDELPHNLNGKVDRKLLKEDYIKKKEK